MACAENGSEAMNIDYILQDAVEKLSEKNLNYYAALKVMKKMEYYTLIPTIATF